MKYTITNKQLHNIMINHLDSFKDNRNVVKFDSFIIISEPSINNIDDYDEVIMEYDSNDGRLLIIERFLQDFMSWFPFDIEKSQDFIKNWFEDTFNVKIKYVQS